MNSSDEWFGVHEQIIAERAGGFDDGYLDWAAQWDDVHEQWTLEHIGAAAKPKQDLVQTRKSRDLVWGGREN